MFALVGRAKVGPLGGFHKVLPIMLQLRIDSVEVRPVHPRYLVQHNVLVSVGARLRAMALQPMIRGVICLVGQTSRD
jgi:hypothetical protein